MKHLRRGRGAGRWLVTVTLALLFSSASHADDENLQARLERMEQIMQHKFLAQELLVVNRKRTYRIYSQLGWQVGTKQREKLTRPRVPLLVPSRPNERSSVDFMYLDYLSDEGAVPKLLTCDLPDMMILPQRRWTERRGNHHPPTDRLQAVVGRSSGPCYLPLQAAVSRRVNPGVPGPVGLRVFAIDMETCPECGGTPRVIACIEEPALITQILGHDRRRKASIDCTPRAAPDSLPLLKLT